MRTESFREKFDSDARINALLDELSAMRDQIIVLEAQRDVCFVERDLMDTQIMAAAGALAEILALASSRIYVASDDIRRCITPPPGETRG